jgi:hypothetical protein
MTYRPRSRMLVLASASALVIATGILAAPAFGSDTAVPHCSSAQLQLEFVDTQAATGHRYIDYAFKNVGAAKCALRGYPGAALLNKHGHVLHSSNAKVGHRPLSPVRTVVIEPGKRAFFSFVWADGGFCPGHTFTFYSLRVFPPQDTGTFEWHLGETFTCDDSATVTRVRPKRYPF